MATSMVLVLEGHYWYDTGRIPRTKSLMPQGTKDGGRRPLDNHVMPYMAANDDGQ